MLGCATNPFCWIGVPFKLDRCCALFGAAGTPRLGVELDAPNGKNNGTIKGYRYVDFDFLLPAHFSSLPRQDACCLSPKTTTVSVGGRVPYAQ